MPENVMEDRFFEFMQTQKQEFHMNTEGITAQQFFEKYRN
jgi:hypothetical protein